jgi:NADH dehydrogenase
MHIPESNQPRVVIVGGGFGGLQLAKRLKNKPFQVVLVDRHNYHAFQPLLYQVATAGLEPDSIAYPIRKVFEGQSNFFFRMAEVEAIETESNTLKTSQGDLRYDYLVLATGSKTNFFGNTGIETHGMGMKSVPEALDLRSLFLQNFERALLTDDVNERESLMNFVIVGGGPTGTELAGAIAELKNHILPHDYPDLDIRRMQIHLIEAAPKLLAAMSDSAGKKSYDYLTSLGVQVWLETLVEDYDGLTIKTNTGKTLQSRFLIWAAGVQGAGIPGLPDAVKARGNRIAVNEFSQVNGFENVFAIGDIASMQTAQFPNGHPMVAQPAIQQGQLLAKNLQRLIKKQALKPFKYADRGSLATIGRNKAVADLPGIHLGGIFAWMIWMFVHLMALVGFRNKLVTFINWSWAYVQYDKGARLIIRPFRRK